MGTNRKQLYQNILTGEKVYVQKVEVEIINGTRFQVVHYQREKPSYPLLPKDQRVSHKPYKPDLSTPLVEFMKPAYVFNQTYKRI